MHEQIALRSLIIEATVFAVTVATTYAAAYALSALWYGRILHADAIHRARRQLPTTWLLFNAYLVGGLLADGALPTSPRALGCATLLMLGLTLPLWLWSRLRGRPGRRPAAASLAGGALLPWLVAWVVQVAAR